ncbi:MAG: serine hydrolase [Acidobacteria bacterium]|nr:serine hydrolase [Acidobacteriota bacterium]
MRIAALFGLTLLAANLPAADLDARLAEFRNFLPQFRQDHHIQSLSVALVHDGKIVLAEGLGWQDHDAEEPTTPETTYLVASITKTFTAATLLGMAADGIIDLDDDFTTLSDWDERCEWLANSGIIFGGGTLDDGTVVEPVRCQGPLTLRQVLSHRVQGKPGSKFLYNPVVYGRLANWVEEKTGRPWRDWMNQYVLDPAGLDDVAAGWRDPRKCGALTNLAPPFRIKEDGGIAHSPLPNPELNASSGIIAGVLGLAKYSIALDEGKILSPQLREQMWTPPTDPDGSPAPYALGWYVQPWEGHRLVWHGGWWPDAYAGLLLKAPDDGWALIALGNTDGVYWGNRLGHAEVEKSDLARKFLELFVRP